MADEERKKLLDALQEQQRRRDDEAQAHAGVVQKLRAMEEKMLVGSQVMEKAMQQEQELKRAEIEVQERKRQEARMKEELEHQVEEKLALEEKYSSVEDQVQKMTAKLEKLWHRHKQTQQEIQDLQREFQHEREDMLETIRELRKEVKLVCLTTESFVPMDHYHQIVENAYFDECTDEWVIKNIELAGNRVRAQRNREDSMSSPNAHLWGTSSADGHEPCVPEQIERPNVYFVYTDDGPQRAPLKGQRSQRTKSAGRPGTASRKGRAVKSSSGTDTSLSMSNFLHSHADGESSNMSGTQYPKARGLVKAA